MSQPSNVQTGHFFTSKQFGHLFQDEKQDTDQEINSEHNIKKEKIKTIKAELKASLFDFSSATNTYTIKKGKMREYMALLIKERAQGHIKSTSIQSHRDLENVCIHAESLSALKQSLNKNFFDLLDKSVLPKDKQKRDQINNLNHGQGFLVFLASSEEYKFVTLRSKIKNKRVGVELRIGRGG